MIPLVDLAAQYAAIKAEVGAAIDSVLEAQSFIQGPFVARFEAEFNAAHGARFGVGCSNGTAAIQLALEALRVGAGDEVITVPNTFIATVEAIVQVGATPVFVDIDARRTASTAPHRGGGHAAHEGDPAGAPLRPSGGHGRDDGGRRAPRPGGGRGPRAGARRRPTRARASARLGDAGMLQLLPGQEPRRLRRRRPRLHATTALARAVAKLRDHGRIGKYEHDVIGANNRSTAIQAAVLRSSCATCRPGRARGARTPPSTASCCAAPAPCRSRRPTAPSRSIT